MKKIYFLLLTFASFTAMGQNLLLNGGFENFTGTTPDDWTTIESGITTDEETTIVNEGSKSLKIDLTTGTQGNTDFRQTINVENGVTYNVSVDIYHVNGDNDANIRFFVDNYENYSDASIVDSWQTITVTYTATANETIEVGLRFYDLSGFDGSSIMYLDNFIFVDPTTLSTQNFEKTTFSMYPNPTSNGFVNIKTSNNEATQVAVYDILGKQVINTTLSAQRLNVSSLKAGVYAVRLSQGNTVTTKKLVIK